MLQIETSSNSELPVLGPSKAGEIVLTSAEVLIIDESGEHEEVAIMARRIEGRKFLSILRKDEAGKYVDQPTYLRRNKVAVDALLFDRGDGQDMLYPADRVRLVEKRLGTGATRLVIGVRLIDPEPVPPLGPPKLPH